ncbi:MAG: hypothetical protein LRY69_05835, partial [Gammaproteobacteria bacterium]|nr:hypothetical protein [Gammaproteobacteria bacterium]
KNCSNSRLLWNIHHEIRVEKLHLIKSFPLLVETIKDRIKKNSAGIFAKINQQSLPASKAAIFDFLSPIQRMA